MFSAAQSSSLSSQFMRLSGILGPGVLPGLPELPPCKVRYMYGNDCRPLLSIFLHVMPWLVSFRLLIEQKNDSKKSPKELYSKER